jgi:hypothetical protein
LPIVEALASSIPGRCMLTSCSGLPKPVNVA